MIDNLVRAGAPVPLAQQVAHFCQADSGIPKAVPRSNGERKREIEELRATATMLRRQLLSLGPAARLGIQAHESWFDCLDQLAQGCDDYVEAFFPGPQKSRKPPDHSGDWVVAHLAFYCQAHGVKATQNKVFVAIVTACFDALDIKGPNCETLDPIKPIKKQVAFDKLKADAQKARALHKATRGPA